MNKTRCVCIRSSPGHVLQGSEILRLISALRVESQTQISVHRRRRTVVSASPRAGAGARARGATRPVRHRLSLA